MACVLEKISRVRGRGSATAITLQSSGCRLAYLE
jgi:hypothetical protein